MTIRQTIDFIDEFKKTHPDLTFDRVLEVGSKQVSLGTGVIREVVSAEKEYIGIDLSEGPGVDIAMNSHDIKKKFKAEEFDLVVSSDSFEHDDKWWESVEGMRWALKPGGYMLITVPGGNCPFHEWPGDYWRFMPDGVAQMFKGYEDLVVDTFTKNPGGDIYDEIFAYGKKPLNG